MWDFFVKTFHFVSDVIINNAVPLLRAMVTKIVDGAKYYSGSLIVGTVVVVASLAIKDFFFDRHHRQRAIDLIDENRRLQDEAARIVPLRNDVSRLSVQEAATRDIIRNLIHRDQERVAELANSEASNAVLRQVNEDLQRAVVEERRQRLEAEQSQNNSFPQPVHSNNNNTNNNNVSNDSDDELDQQMRHRGP